MAHSCAYRGIVAMLRQQEMFPLPCSSTFAFVSFGSWPFGWNMLSVDVAGILVRSFFACFAVQTAIVGCFPVMAC